MTKLTTPKSSSIFWTEDRPSPWAFALAIVLNALLYWRSYTGVPIWDDVTYWFFDPWLHKASFGWIWKYSTWPFSVYLQKYLQMSFGTKWFAYHSFSVLVHSVNSLLVYVLLRSLNLREKLAFAGFLLFLIHPASSITVGWMIQFKTLVCFTFAILSLIIFIKGRAPADFGASYLLYLFSILSKSASLPLPIALLFLLRRPLKRKKNLYVIPFFLIAAFGAWRINFSKVAVEGVKEALESTGRGIPKAQESIQKEEAPPTPEEEAIARNAQENVISSSNATPEGFNHSLEGSRKKMKMVELSPIQARKRLLIKTLNYYFWQSFFPVNNVPVKGQNPFPPDIFDYLHIVFLAILFYFSGQLGLISLLAMGHVFLLPYLGLIPAPYMNVTWVSDQHLYFALPFFLALGLVLLDLAKFKYKEILVGVFVFFFMFKTFEASGFYRDSYTFYGSSIDANYDNTPLVYNLAILYIANGKNNDAVDLLEKIFTYSRKERYIRQDKYFPYLVQLYSRLEPYNSP